MTTGERLIMAVRDAREREEEAWAVLRQLGGVEEDARKRAWACRTEADAAEAALIAFTKPPVPSVTFEDDFIASVDRALAVVADQARARTTAPAG